MAQVTKANVFITGAATGIGAATTKLLAQNGYRVFGGMHRETGSLADLAGVEPVVIDVTDPSSVASAAKMVEA
jgi:NADP-dependent 3-hydroxy acid dehydrogenase YdfG